MKKKIKLWLYYNKPRIYSLPQVIYIVWRDNEYIIKKYNQNQFKH